MHPDFTKDNEVLLNLTLCNGIDKVLSMFYSILSMHYLFLKFLAPLFAWNNPVNLLHFGFNCFRVYTPSIRCSSKKTVSRYFLDNILLSERKYMMPLFLVV